MPSAAAAVGSVGHDDVVPPAGSLQLHAAVLIGIDLPATELRHALQHRNVNGTASPGFLALDQRRQDGREGIHSRRQVGDGYAYLTGLVRCSRQADDPALALYQQVESLLGVVRSTAAAVT